ncbi:MAG: hypothetical protein VW270_05240 [Candidatus Poseidoniales archaeon]
MSMHKIVERRRLLGDRRLRDEIVEVERREGTRREIIEEFRRRMDIRRTQNISVGTERRLNSGRRVDDKE